VRHRVHEAFDPLALLEPRGDPVEPLHDVVHGGDGLLELLAGPLEHRPRRPQGPAERHQGRDGGPHQDRQQHHHRGLPALHVGTSS
jgi:hypothetical protein